MSRKTAIHITSAQVAAAEYQTDARKDAHAADGHAPTVIEIIRAARDQMDERELLRLARSAAYLELRPPNFGAEDRADCAGELVWHVMAECNGATPRRSSEHATLSYLCGLAKNWRKSRIRKNAAEDRAAKAEEDRRAINGEALLDMIPDTSPAYLAAALAQNVESAHAFAASIVDRLDLPRGGAVYARMYQWARNRSADICAADNGVKLSTWKDRTQRGGAMIRAAYPDPSDLLGALTDSAPIAADGHIIYATEDQSREASRTSPGWTIQRERDQKPREGTDNGARPPRAETAEEARELCAIRHCCPTPGLADIGRARLRRGHYVAAPMIQSAGEHAPRGFLWIEGKTAQQMRADALRTLARESARSSAREASVHYTETAGFGA